MERTVQYHGRERLLCITNRQARNLLYDHYEAGVLFGNDFQCTLLTDPGADGDFNAGECG